MNLKTNLIAALAAAALATSAGPALATITASSVTSPADGTAYAYDAATPTQIASVTGTAAGTGNVDLRCAYQDGTTWSYSAILTGGASIAVDGGGSWSASNVTLPTNKVLCRLIAVPEGPTPTDPSAFAGPRLRLLVTKSVNDNNGQGNQGKQADYAGNWAGTSADAYLASAAANGVDDTYLVSGAPGDQGQVFGSADYIRDTDPATGPDHDNTATGITVDGINSFLGPSWEDQATGSLMIAFGSYTPFPGVSETRAVAADGSLVVTEHDTIVRCTTTDPNYYPPAGFTCQGLQDSGVALDVTTTMNHAGTVVSRQWSFSATDGYPHQVHLVQVFGAANNSGPRAWRFPAEAGYAQHANGDVVANPAQAPWTVRFNTPGAADGDATEGVGAVTFGQVPGSLRFTGIYSLVPTSTLTVPATGDVKLREILMSEATQAALEADIAAAEAALGGTPLPPPGGGGTTPPPPGGGNPAAPSPPRIVKSGKAKLKGSKLSLGYALDCPGAGPGCSASIAIVPKAKKAKKAAKRKRIKPLAKGTVKAAAGKRATLVLKVSKKNRAKLRHGRFTLTITLRRGTLASTKLSKTVKLR